MLLKLHDSDMCSAFCLCLFQIIKRAGLGEKFLSEISLGNSCPEVK